jgi:uncharacterized protein YjeT (DUF2065 family)
VPFLAPKVWRDTFRSVTELADGQIRFIGLSSMLVGVVLLMVAAMMRWRLPEAIEDILPLEAWRVERCAACAAR